MAVVAGTAVVTGAPTGAYIEAGAAAYMEVIVGGPAQDDIAGPVATMEVIAGMAAGMAPDILKT
jgi:hypothetical protein